MYQSALRGQNCISVRWQLELIEKWSISLSVKHKGPTKHRKGGRQICDYHEVWHPIFKLSRTQNREFAPR